MYNFIIWCVLSRHRPASLGSLCTGNFAALNYKGGACIVTVASLTTSTYLIEGTYHHVLVITSVKALNSSKYCSSIDNMNKGQSESWRKSIHYCRI